MIEKDYFCDVTCFKVAKLIYFTSHFYTGTTTTFIFT